MKKGFTLIEMIASLTVISAIILITVPQVKNLLKTEENNEYEQFLSSIYLATESYISKKNDEFPDLKTIGGTACINMEDIVREHFLKSTEISTKTNESILSSSITVTLNDKYQFDYVYQDGSKC